MQTVIARNRPAPSPGASDGPNTLQQSAPRLAARLAISRQVSHRPRDMPAASPAPTQTIPRAMPTPARSRAGGAKWQDGTILFPDTDNASFPQVQFSHFHGACRILYRRVRPYNRQARKGPFVSRELATCHMSLVPVRATWPRSMIKT